VSANGGGGKSACTILILPPLPSHVDERVIMPSRSWHADRRPFLLSRMRIVAALRQYFADRGFLEVETSTLVASPGNETHIHAFATDWMQPSGGRERLYLRTSPEFACKKLLALGEPRIVEFARSFRNRESGALHQPEFTMLEWYRANEFYEVLMKDCTNVLALAAQTTGAGSFSFRGRSMDPFAEAERLTVAEAFARHASIDLMNLLPPKPVAAFADAASRAGVRVAQDDGWGDVFSRVLVERVEPHLGVGRATILDEYPAVQSPLSRPSDRDRRLAQRFELYACGIELANACGELVDANEQRSRLEQQMAEKERIYGERYPIDEDFLAALEQMQPAWGAALGLDRLIMLATGATSIDQVIWTPH
jgi:elongation factor P--(R)-beta-lysine ligase